MKKKILLAGEGLEDLRRILQNAGYPCEVVQDHGDAMACLFRARDENDPDRYTAAVFAPKEYHIVEWNGITAGSE